MNFMDTMKKLLTSWVAGEPVHPPRVARRPVPAQALVRHYARVMNDDAHFRASEASRFVA